MKLSALVGAAALAMTGCAAEPRVDCTEGASMMWSNGIGWSNGIMWGNGILWANSMIWSNSIMWTNGAMWANGLDGIDQVETGCDGQALEVLEYTVGCALRADQSLELVVDGELHAIDGAIGLAPQWADGPCDDTCQRWVSACLIASINAKGESVPIAIDGDHPALHPGDDVPGDTRPEASYYGNVFSDPPQLAACLAPGVPRLDRSCGDDPSCAIEVAGACADVCDERGCVDRSGHRYEQVISVSLVSPAHPAELR